MHAPRYAHRAPAARATPSESAELALGTQEERKGMTRGHAASTPGRILRSD